ncbi:uncharacterized protein LY89DRAFT_743922 [Mollisia scopiformis]|uniref:Mid2 domain-containing protein n=1 Tax=Mollisia scopiformis TaxID=149040 RepID=A0A132B1Q2_MOLSC|nr:uncharacterized protein LY89DRAFT_743922 [Mollisia scopiformis]KUJ06306.1 hypothetical protein LY89DRAFT_743922 [Mollisia scopiformis]
MENFEPNETAFPLSCHAELAGTPLGSGFDSLAGIIWSSNPAEAAKTISQIQAASSVTVTVVSTASPSPTSTLAPSSSAVNTIPSQVSTISSSYSSSSSSSSTTTTTTTTNTLLQSTTSTPSTTQLITSPTKTASSSPKNTGAIIGGVIGSIALLSFIILALLFLRKYQRDHSSPITTEDSRRSFYLSNMYKKRGMKAPTTGIFEKPGDHGAHEKEGTSLSHEGQVHEKEGSDALRWEHIHEM